MQNFIADSFSQCPAVTESRLHKEARMAHPPKKENDTCQEGMKSPPKHKTCGRNVHRFYPS